MGRGGQSERVKRYPLAAEPSQKRPKKGQEMTRVSTENLRSQIKQADAHFRDLFEDVSTDDLTVSLQAFGMTAAKCPATAVFATIADLGTASPLMITSAISRALAMVLLARMEAEADDGA